MAPTPTPVAVTNNPALTNKTHAQEIVELKSKIANLESIIIGRIAALKKKVG